MLKQVQVQQNQQKKYKGQLRTERLAARVYDKRAIFAYGIKAKTNFNYTKKQLDRIIATNDDIEEDVLTMSEMEETLTKERKNTD